jgi:hypothetical protein
MSKSKWISADARQELVRALVDHVFYDTRLALDVEGNTLSVTDARGNTTLAHTYCPTGGAIQSVNAETGSIGERNIRASSIESPSDFPNGQLRTLQRRIRDWRRATARKLVFAMDDLPGGAASDGDVARSN